MCVASTSSGGAASFVEYVGPFMADELDAQLTESVRPADEVIIQDGGGAVTILEGLSNAQDFYASASNGETSGFSFDFSSVSGPTGVVGALPTPCFVPGTLIATPGGEVPVERLHPATASRCTTAPPRASGGRVIGAAAGRS